MLNKEAVLTLSECVHVLRSAERFDYSNAAFLQAVFDRIDRTSENVSVAQLVDVCELLISYEYRNAQKYLDLIIGRFVKSGLVAFHQKRFDAKKLTPYQLSVLMEAFSFYRFKLQ